MFILLIISLLAIKFVPCCLLSLQYILGNDEIRFPLLAEHEFGCPYKSCKSLNADCSCAKIHSALIQCALKFVLRLTICEKIVSGLTLSTQFCKEHRKLNKIVIFHFNGLDFRKTN
jgi:hypothetical protein